MELLYGLKLKIRDIYFAVDLSLPCHLKRITQRKYKGYSFVLCRIEPKVKVKLPLRQVKKAMNSVTRVGNRALHFRVKQTEQGQDETGNPRNMELYTL